MGHEHHHQHSHVVSANVNKAFIIGILLNALFVMVEMSVGFYVDSLALISDAWHNLSDVGTLVLAMVAFKLSKLSATNTFSYGFKKTTILISLVNSIIMLVVVGGIIVASVRRIELIRSMDGGVISIVALIGIAINSVSAFLFFRDKDKDLNVKGAYIHLLADALVSLGVVISGFIIMKTNLYWIDTLVSIIIALVILYSTFDLLKDSLILTLDGKPHDIDLQKIKASINAVTGVKDVHHIHIWAISTTENAMTAHVVIDSGLELTNLEDIKHEIRHTLEHLGIQHTTLEFECENVQCKGCC